jgi:probable F420-dependent oxidoreductase
MHYGISVPIFGPYGDVRVLARLARDTEESGWDGFFVWDHIAMPSAIPVIDPWIALAVIAATTERIRIGTCVTPLSRRRPWKVARETVTLDHFSHGRMVFGVGLGYSPEEFSQFGEPADPKLRAAMLDEGLEVLTGLWRGEPFTYSGKHYQIKESLFLPTPVQSPRIPIWVAGTWPNKAPFRRAARWDGVVPMMEGATVFDKMSPDQVREMLATIRQHRQSNSPFDVAHVGLTPDEDRTQDAKYVEPYAEAGVTWWMEEVHPTRWGTNDNWPLAAMRQRILNGPPRF